jgi:hypothetical protein
MAGENVWIWQVQTSAGNGSRTTATTTNTQAFNNTDKMPSDGAYISDIDVDFRRAVPENEAVNANNNELQDMGVEGFDIVITGVSGDADNDTASNLVNKVSKWLQDGNTTTGYTKGRYGIELTNAPQWNVTPTATYGYHLKDAKFQYIGENKDLVKFTIRLSLGGDINSAI